MTWGERFHKWNVWYDGLPSEWRFQLILWPVIILGAINFMLTVSTRFPFGLLLLLGILFLALVRLPYVLGRPALDGAVASGDPNKPLVRISGASWLIDLNRRYEAMPDERRVWVFPAVLVIAGAINMLLTIGSGFPFGLLFLLALLAIVAMRGSYTAGWLRDGEAVAMPPAAAPPARIDHAPSITPAPTIAADPAPLSPSPVSTSTPMSSSPVSSAYDPPPARPVEHGGHEEPR